MRNLFFFLVAAVCLCGSVFAQADVKNDAMPVLHTIQNATLSPSYSCRTGDKKPGYGETALFISEFSKRFNNPDLLFNGACRAADYFTASTAGDDMSLIADLGENVSLEELSASKAFNVKGIHSFAEYSKFAMSVAVAENHTYAVLLNESGKRGLFLFTVVKYVQNEKVELNYAVKSYQILSGDGAVSSEGFNWGKTSK